MAGKTLCHSKSKQPKVLVAAIDFGTTYSGYAYSLLSDYKRDHGKIYANKAWPASEGEALVTMKTPTIVLFDKDAKFHSFGFEAEEKYMALAQKQQQIGWRYFRRFKMKLSERLNLKKDFKLLDDQGKSMEARRVFAAAIGYLKDSLLQQTNKSTIGVKETDIFWVLTVPAIWHDGARQFMVECAKMAGIPEDRQTIALEPECAAIYCKESLGQTTGDLTNFDPGSQFMVVDLGGGTVDITVHEIDRHGNLMELTSASGGPWGGTCVDRAFNGFLIELFSKRVLDLLSKEDELDLQRMFEVKKRAFKKEREHTVITLSDLFEIYDDEVAEDFATRLQKNNLETVERKRNKLIIKSSKFLAFFKEPIENVRDNLISLLSRYDLRHLKTLLLVGGFAECNVMSDAIKEAFPDKHVIVPAEAGLAVVKGAVMYGHNPDLIISRIMPYTIGISTSVPFDDQKHPSLHKVMKDGTERCEDVFKVFIKKGEEVVCGQTKVEHSLSTNLEVSTIEIYRSFSDEPQFVTDEDCKCIGEVSLQLGSVEQSSGKLVVVQMVFGGTQIEVKAKEKDSDKWSVKANINFLR